MDGAHGSGGHQGADMATDMAAVRPDPAPVRLGPQGAHPQFIVECEWSHSALDDPIVMPGGQCPDAQPVPMVQLILAVRYPFDSDPSNLRLASGPMITGHGDVMNGWRHDELAKLTQLCLNRSEVCGVSSSRTDV
jgi:hypothetical protein